MGSQLSQLVYGFHTQFPISACSFKKIMGMAAVADETDGESSAVTYKKGMSLHEGSILLTCWVNDTIKNWL